jgi:hypothetical protein
LLLTDAVTAKPKVPALEAAAPTDSDRSVIDRLVCAVSKTLPNAGALRASNACCDQLSGLTLKTRTCDDGM